MRFFLGTHQPHWLRDERFENVPLFVSRRTLCKVRNLPRAVGPWALDSGGFSELQIHGQWTLSPAQYVGEVRRFRDEIGQLVWAAPQDWMCEPPVIHGGTHGPLHFHGTGLSIAEHQRRTVDNLIELRTLAPDLHFIPVLQGWSLFDYWRCEELYDKVGVDLRAEPTIGVGTMCRRQSTMEAGVIIQALASDGLSLHGFGFKIKGLIASAPHLFSADSMAWSYSGRRAPPLDGHDRPGPGRPKGHKNCANCAEYALLWHDRVLGALDQSRRTALAASDGQTSLDFTGSWGDE